MFQTQRILRFQIARWIVTAINQFPLICYTAKDDLIDIVCALNYLDAGDILSTAVQWLFESESEPWKTTRATKTIPAPVLFEMVYPLVHFSVLAAACDEIPLVKSYIVCQSKKMFPEVQNATDNTYVWAWTEAKQGEEYPYSSPKRYFLNTEHDWSFCRPGVTVIAASLSRHKTHETIQQLRDACESIISKRIQEEEDLRKLHGFRHAFVGHDISNSSDEKRWRKKLDREFEKRKKSVENCVKSRKFDSLSALVTDQKFKEIINGMF
jgi:hypothetical protein